MFRLIIIFFSLVLVPGNVFVQYLQESLNLLYKPFWAENIFENNFVANPKKRPVFTEPNKSSHFNLYTIRIA